MDDRSHSNREAVWSAKRAKGGTKQTRKGYADAGSFVFALFVSPFVSFVIQTAVRSKQLIWKQVHQLAGDLVQ